MFWTPWTLLFSSLLRSKSKSPDPFREGPSSLQPGECAAANKLAASFCCPSVQLVITLSFWQRSSVSIWLHYVQKVKQTEPHVTFNTSKAKKSAKTPLSSVYLWQCGFLILNVSWVASWWGIVKKKKSASWSFLPSSHETFLFCSKLASSPYFVFTGMCYWGNQLWGRKRMNSSAQSLHQTQRVTRLRYILVYLHDCGESLLVCSVFLVYAETFLLSNSSAVAPQIISLWFYANYVRPYICSHKKSVPTTSIIGLAL